MPKPESLSTETRLASRQHSEFVLTDEFAKRVRAVVKKLPRDLSFNDLYFATHTRPSKRAGQEWFDFVSSLKGEKGSLTRALIGLSTQTGPTEKPLTLGEFDWFANGGLVGWKIHQITADFLLVAFGHEDESLSTKP